MTSLTVDEAFRRALASCSAGDFATAEKLARAVLGLEPGHPAGCLLALILEQRGESAEAEEVLRQVAARPAFSITLDYPVAAIPRHGVEPHRQLHALLQGEAARYEQALRGFSDYLPWLGRIPAESVDDVTPHWSNIWLPPIDAAALYVHIAQSRPLRYVEIGSGNSTKFARRAIEDHGLATEITSIDPSPRAPIDELCDARVRTPFEDADLSMFSGLAPGDVVFVDNSHRCFMNSDATVFFTEVLPVLPRGVIVGVHDIFLPYDYPEAWVGRYYSEQYLLACYLLGRTPLFRVLLPAHLLLRMPGTKEMAEALCAALPGAPRPAGSSFWIEMTGDLPRRG